MRPCTAGVDRLHRPVDDRQRAQAEEVELHQPDRLDVVLVELRDRALAAAVAVVFGEQRAEVAQRGRGDHHAAGVLAGVAGQILEAAREVEQVADIVLAAVALDQLGRGQHWILLRRLGFAQCIVETDAQRHRDQLGDAVDEAIRMAEHAAGVAHDGLRGHGPVGDDLADAVAAVLRRHVVDDLVATVHAEVDVEVGHRHAFGVEEPLEQQVVRQRVEVGDAQRPRDQRTGTRTAARTDRDVLALGPVDEVRDDQEVAREPHLQDHAELGLQPRVVDLAALARRERGLLQPPGETLARLLAQPRFDRVFAGHRECRQRVFAELEFDVAARRQRDRVADRVGDVGEQLRHLRRRLQVLLSAVLLRPLRIVEHAAGGDAHARLVRLEPVGVEEARIVARDHRDAALRGRVQRECVERVLAVAAGAGEFQMQAIAQRALPVGEPGFGQFMPVAGRQAPGQAVAAGEREQPGIVLAQPLRPHHDAVGLVAFHPRPAEQPRQREIPAAVAAQQGHARWRLVAIGQMDVGADDRLQPGGLGGLVELHRREQIVDVGQRHRRLAERDAALHQFGDADRRIGERIFAVQVEMDEGCGHGATVAAVRISTTRRLAARGGRTSLDTARRRRVARTRGPYPRPQRGG